MYDHIDVSLSVFASLVVIFDLIFMIGYNKNFKNMFAASLLDDLHKPNSVKKKLANLHVASLGKILDEIVSSIFMWHTGDGVNCQMNILFVMA